MWCVSKECEICKLCEVCDVCEVCEICRECEVCDVYKSCGVYKVCEVSEARLQIAPSSPFRTAGHIRPPRPFLKIFTLLNNHPSSKWCWNMHLIS